jgi:hypothetical protein
MLPYLREVITKVSTLVNEEKCQELGSYMLESACKAIETDEGLIHTFIKCVEHAGVECLETTVLHLLHSKLSKKLFYARANEHMKASTELELEKKGKAVNAEQSLRDKLKTFSSIQNR